METAYGNPTSIEKTCEWTGRSFTVDWKHRHRRFIDRRAMYEWRKAQNHEIVKCIHCGEPFSRRKRERHWRSGKPTQYCSQKCFAQSEHHRSAARSWTIQNQPMNSPESRSQISKTKLKRYGDASYNNMEKTTQTCLTKYGVEYFVDSPQMLKSNGRRISKFQREKYESILKQFPDALLENYLIDARRSVDIYIPSQKTIIECYGDYWHMNPKQYDATYYNKSMKMEAWEIWDYDARRLAHLRSFGYTVDVVWESDWKRTTS